MLRKILPDSLKNYVPHLVDLQYLKDEGFQEAARVFEQTSGVFFDVSYWNEAEKYLLRFIRIDENPAMFLKIRTHKFLEALHKTEMRISFDIYMDELRCFHSHKQELDELSKLFLSNYSHGDIRSKRLRVISELTDRIHYITKLAFKARFPEIEQNRLLKLIDQGLKWQRSLCTHIEGEDHELEFETLFLNRCCPNSPTSEFIC